ncbi:MAG: S41 family peptidase [Bacteroidetes bacterium]|nr:S41 family peptidase [Bacteroidota bacterium]
MKRLSGYLLIVVFIFMGFPHLTAQPPVNNGFEILKNLDIYSTLVKVLNDNYVDNINPGDLTKTGIDAMLETLDPYTNYIPESEVEDYRFITTGEYGGIGALIHQQGDYVIISEPYEGSPAQKNDLRAGDKIVEINNQSALKKSYSDVSAILKGQPGTSISMKIMREGTEKPIEKTITRETIKVDNIPYSGMVGNDIAYIKLNGFTQNAGQEVKQAFLKLKESHDVKGVIIDLRGNGGGLLDEAVNITNIFVDKNQEVVITKGKLPDKNHTHRTMYPPVDLAIPLAILVDKGSASASEILAGAIQDLDRGVIIGQRTFGKGLVQNVVPLSYNAQLKVTVAKYYIPSGRCIQAIDYSHKNKQGTFSLYPDSLLHNFKTKDGRTVAEGRGIKPDVLTSPVDYSNIALTLYTKYLIFDYATSFTREHPSIPSAGNFRITDSIFNDFQKFLSGKNYTYKTKSEQSLEDLKKNAEKEHYFDAMKPEYDALEKQISNDKKGDLMKFKKQIENLIRVEIAGRYYYQKGKVQASLAEDSDLATAISTLHDPTKYKSILEGTYKQPNPPKPEDNSNTGAEDSDN